MGGAWFQEAFGDPEAVSEQKLLERATQAVTSHLGVKASPIWSLVALLKVRSRRRREEQAEEERRRREERRDSSAVRNNCSEILAGIPFQLASFMSSVNHVSLQSLIRFPLQAVELIP